ncbi:MAG: antibiotic biosynthesis monooxygenase [Pseudomonadota bacterium]
MALTFIARMKIHPEKEAAFIDACERMEKAVAANEPGALLYRFYRLREDNAFAVIESFADHAAEEAHQASAHFKEIAPAMIDCIDGGWEREYLDPLKA